MSEVTVCLPCFFPSRSAVFVGAGADDDDAATLEAGWWDFFLFFFTGGQGTWVIKRASIFHGKKKERKEKKSLTSPVKAEDHGGNSASFGAICCVGGPRCAAPHGNTGLEGEGVQTNPNGC